MSVNGQALDFDDSLRIEKPPTILKNGATYTG
jgi:hypothetical protein